MILLTLIWNLIASLMWLYFCSNDPYFNNLYDLKGLKYTLFWNLKKNIYLKIQTKFYKTIFGKLDRFKLRKNMNIYETVQLT
jgi:hypothetical protein